MADVTSSAMPDEFDRLSGQLDGIPGVSATKPSTIQEIGTLGVGTSTFIVKTVRQQDFTIDKEGKEVANPATFVTFLECYAQNKNIRLVIPHKVGNLIMRQRTTLTDQANSKTAKRAAQTRKARGFEPNFKARDTKTAGPLRSLPHKGKK